MGRDMNGKTQFKLDYSVGVGAVLGDWLKENEVSFDEASAHYIQNDPVLLEEIVNGDFLVSDSFIESTAELTGISKTILTNLNSNNRLRWVRRGGIR